MKHKKFDGIWQVVNYISIAWFVQLTKKRWFEFVQANLFQVGGCQGTLPIQQKAKGFEVVVKNIEWVLIIMT